MTKNNESKSFRSLRKGFKMKEMNFKIHLTKVIDEFSLEKIYASTDVDKVMIETPEINRPALQIAGFYDYFDPKRLRKG